MFSKNCSCCFIVFRESPYFWPLNLWHYMENLTWLLPATLWVIYSCLKCFSCEPGGKPGGSWCTPGGDVSSLAPSGCQWIWSARAEAGVAKPSTVALASALHYRFPVVLIWVWKIETSSFFRLSVGSTTIESGTGMFDRWKFVLHAHLNLKSQSSSVVCELCLCGF